MTDSISYSKNLSNRPSQISGSDQINHKASEKVEKGNRQLFEALLREAQIKKPDRQEIPSSSLKFSMHSLDRAKQRGVLINQEVTRKLEGALESAQKKGLKEIVALGEDAAWILNVKNSTVVTVVDKASLVGNVFTNVDGAVVI